jgi:hypothetical protein
MLGQFLVEPEPVPEPALELALDPAPVDEFEEPEPVPPVFEPDDGAVVGEELDVEEPELVPELVPEVPELDVVPELPVVVDVVAALATSAPPATRPDVSAPMASTLRRRICMVGISFRVSQSRRIRAGISERAPRI